MTIAQEAAEIKSLVGELAADTAQLLRTEGELAKREVRAEVERATKKAVAAGVGAAVLFLGGAFLLLAVMGLLALLMPWWLAAAIVGAVTSLIGGGLLLRARSLQAADVIPEQALRRLQTDVRAVGKALR